MTSLTQGSSVRFSGICVASGTDFNDASLGGAVDSTDIGSSAKYDLFINQTGAAAAALTAYVGDATGTAAKLDVDEAEIVARAAHAQLEKFLDTNYPKVSKITIRVDMTT